MLTWAWRRFLAERVTAAVHARMADRLDGLVDARIAAELAAVRDALPDPALSAAILDRLARVESKMDVVESAKPWKQNLHLPRLGVHPPADGPAMRFSTCSAADFFHPEFQRYCGTLEIDPSSFHRKYWEWAFILHHALRTGAVGPGRRALGFAVGSEPLPSAFAALGTQVTATDAPAEIGVGQGWSASGEFAGGLDQLHHAGIVDRPTFERLVSFRPVDMNRIDADLAGFDFCWSSCSLEHLGTLQRGTDFVIESVERTLRPGGVACHTTEFNLSSDDETVSEGPTVLYRLQDMRRLAETLERRGHTVDPILVAPDSHVLDSFVDTPPYAAPPHLKLSLLGYASTSIGVVVRRGG